MDNFIPPNMLNFMVSGGLIMEVIWKENELIYCEHDQLIAYLGFRQLDDPNHYVIERIWTKNDETLNSRLIQSFINHFDNDRLRIIPLCPEALNCFNQIPEWQPLLLKPAQNN